MFISHLKRIILCGCVLLLLAVAACNTQGNTNTTTRSPNTPVSTSTQPQPPSQAKSTPTSKPSSNGVPIVILSPTPVPGGNSFSQIVTLPDRTLIINNVSKQPGADASSTAITLVMTIKNTSVKSIMNEASFFQLIGAEGDTFGQSNATTSFFGTIISKSSRNGTIIFQVPTAAINGLRLLYRSEIATETVFVSLNV